MGDVSVTFRHLEATAALREYAVEKASKIRNYFGEPNEITIVLSSEKHRYTAEITLKAGRVTANAKEETEDLYTAVDIDFLKLHVGISNLFDKNYADHLNRSNAFDAEEVQVNEPGRSFFVRLKGSF